MSALIAEFTRAGSLAPIGASLSPAQRKELISEMSKSGNASRGREIYLRPALVCATCHAVNGTGGKVGPDLSTVGTYMTPESLLESLLNPGASIKQGYETVLITLTDGEIRSGLLHRKTATATLLRLPDGEIVSIPSQEIAKIDVSPVSLMPAGLTRGLHEDELRDLLAYLIALGREG